MENTHNRLGASSKRFEIFIKQLISVNNGNLYTKQRSKSCTKYMVKTHFKLLMVDSLAKKLPLYDI